MAVECRHEFLSRSCLKTLQEECHGNSFPTRLVAEFHIKSPMLIPNLPDSSGVTTGQCRAIKRDLALGSLSRVLNCFEPCRSFRIKSLTICCIGTIRSPAIYSVVVLPINAENLTGHTRFFFLSPVLSIFLFNYLPRKVKQTPVCGDGSIHLLSKLELVLVQACLTVVILCLHPIRRMPCKSLENRSLG